MCRSGLGFPSTYFAETLALLSLGCMPSSTYKRTFGQASGEAPRRAFSTQPRGERNSARYSGRSNVSRN
jgi:hypothetical protein